MSQSLADVRGLFERVIGQPAPELPPHAYSPFPPGVDPVTFAVREVEQLERICEQIAAAPAPCAWVPRADSYLAEDAFVVLIEIPGVAREDLNVFATGGECVVRGERQPPQSGAPLRPMTVELPYGAFERRFVLPTGSDVDRIDARFVDGVLHLRIPIAPEPKTEPDRIDIK